MNHVTKISFKKDEIHKQIFILLYRMLKFNLLWINSLFIIYFLYFLDRYDRIAIQYNDIYNYNTFYIYI